MRRKIEDLEAHAYKFWPNALARLEQSTSIIPRLITSQEKFIGILYVADASPTAWKDVLQSTAEMPGNLFLKHLIVLSDVGGEKLQRFRADLLRFFPDGSMTFQWKESQYHYKFKSLKTCKAWTNGALRVDGPGLANGEDLSDAMEDAAMLLVHGGTAIDPEIPDDLFQNCAIGSMIGQKSELDSFVRQRYIHVSRITGGATANKMGQLCQEYVQERMQDALPDWDFSRHTIDKISQNAGRTNMAFDLVGESPSGTFCAIEISFQVTTNSVIERKAGQAVARRKILHAAGHKIAYIIDGAGNFQRRSAINVICANSDCTVSFKDEELDSLVRFLKAIG